MKKQTGPAAIPIVEHVKMLRRIERDLKARELPFAAHMVAMARAALQQKQTPPRRVSRRPRVVDPMVQAMAKVIRSM